VLCSGAGWPSDLKDIASLVEDEYELVLALAGERVMRDGIKASRIALTSGHLPLVSVGAGLSGRMLGCGARRTRGGRIALHLTAMRVSVR